MRSIITAFLVAGILFSCNNSDQTENTEQEASANEAELTNNTSKEKLVEINTEQALVATALMAAPMESREGCKVIGYNMAGEFVTLKEGDNEFICLADDPNQPGFSAACYHKSLEPFMARGRELRAEGKSPKEIFNIREKEAKSGKLKMGNTGSTLHVYYGPETRYNPETSEVAGAHYRYVIYMPWATVESTGLPEVPHAPNHPWLMNPGTHRAHIMITPLTGDNEQNTE